MPSESRYQHNPAYFILGKDATGAVLHDLLSLETSLPTVYRDKDLHLKARKILGNESVIKTPAIDKKREKLKL